MVTWVHGLGCMLSSWFLHFEESELETDEEKAMIFHRKNSLRVKAELGISVTTAPHTHFWMSTRAWSSLPPWHCPLLVSEEQFTIPAPGVWNQAILAGPCREATTITEVRKALSPPFILVGKCDSFHPFASSVWHSKLFTQGEEAGIGLCVFIVFFSTIQARFPPD